MSCTTPDRRPSRPRIFLPDGLADERPNPYRVRAAPPVVVDVVAGREVARPAAAPEPAPVAAGEAATWRCSLKAAEMLCRLLDLPVADGEPAARIRAVADAAVAQHRASCAFAGRSPQGSDVWALPRGVRRIGLVFATGADAPGQRTIVLVLTPSKMEADYPTAAGGPTDWRLRHLRGLYALQALETLADEQGPDSEAARHLAAVQAADEADMLAVLGDVP